MTNVESAKFTFNGKRMIN